MILLANVGKKCGNVGEGVMTKAKSHFSIQIGEKNHVKFSITINNSTVRHSTRHQFPAPSAEKPPPLLPGGHSGPGNAWNNDR